MEESFPILDFTARTFFELGVEYMIVGSMAMKNYVPARSTVDTDILTTMTKQQLKQFIERLGADWYIDETTAMKGLENRRMFNAIHYKTSWKLDIIPLKDNEFHRTEFARRVEGRIGGIPCAVQALEDLILSKLEWGKRGNSSRQFDDVRSLLQAGLELDEAYLLKWAKELRVQELLSEARHE
jgi:hypothetical protein